MIKNYSTYIKEIDHFDYEEEDDDEFEVGDYITVIKMPPRPHWLDESDKKTFKLVGIPTKFFGGKMMWSTDGMDKNNMIGGWGIPEDCFRLATKKEIHDEYGIKESYDYEEEDEEDVSWYEEDRLNNLSNKDIYTGMKVQCIEDCEIESQSWGDRHPIKAGDIKIVKGYGMKDMSQYIWFNDTPNGHGSYKKEYFVKI